MFHMNQNLKVVLAVQPVDLRKSFNGLYAIACSELRAKPETGGLYVFSNRTRTRIKVEEGTFSWPKGTGKKKMSLKPEALALLLDGVDLRGARLRPWYQR